MRKIRNYDASVKARVALEAMNIEPTVSQLAAPNGMHPTITHQWTKALVD